MNTKHISGRRKMYNAASAAYNFINADKGTIIASLLFVGLVSSIQSVYADDLFSVAVTMLTNAAVQLRSVLVVLIPCVILVCVIGLVITKDPRKAEVYKDWLKKAIIALVIVGAWYLVGNTITNLSGGVVNIDTSGLGGN